MMVFFFFIYNDDDDDDDDGDGYEVDKIYKFTIHDGFQH